jgi:hypothetical protein
MNVEINKEKLFGEGDILYTVVYIDKEDSEDSITEMWLANNEDDLSDQVQDSYIGLDDGDEPDPMAIQEFEDKWGFEINYTEVGKVA